MAGLNDSQCRAAKPKEKAYKLSDRDGLYLYVKKNGTKTWRKKFYFHQKEQTLTIGDYPTVSLAEAREQATIANSLIKDGINPNDQKREHRRKIAAEHEHQFEKVARDWFDTRQHDRSAGHRRMVIGRLKREVFPMLGKRAVQKIEKTDVIDVLMKVQSRGVHETTRRVRQYIEAVFEYAIARGIRKDNPAYKTGDVLIKAKAKNYPAINYKDLPEFLTTINAREAQHFPTYSHALKLLMLTGLRTGELRQAKWTEIDFEEAIWSIPAERMKNRKPHQVPLSKQAITILKAQQRISGSDGYVFPQERNVNKPMSENGVLNILYKAGYKHRMTGHGFRSLVATALVEKMQYPEGVVQSQLSHRAGSSTWLAYNRAEYWEDRVKMMQEWADFCEKAGDISPVTFTNGEEK